MTAIRTVSGSSLWALAAAGLFIRVIPGLGSPDTNSSTPFAYDSAASLDWQAHAERSHDGARVLTGSFASPRGGRVPALLVKPDGTGPFAGIVFMHPGGGLHGKDFFLREAVAFSARGAISVLIDAPSKRPGGPPLLGYNERDCESWGQAVVDLRRAVDLLVAQPDVDTNRLGYVGFSYGATLGGVLCGVEPRLGNFVLMAGGPRITDWLKTLEGAGPQQLKRSQQWDNYLARMGVFDAERHVPATRAAVLLQNGTRDGRPDELRRYLDLMGGNPRTLRFYVAGHDPGPDALKDRAAWLTTRLRLPGKVEGSSVSENTAGYIDGLFHEISGQGEPLVFLHGGQLDRRLWDEQFTLFAGTHRVIRYDARGFGKSASPTGVFAHEDDLHTLLDHLGIQRATLIGLSLGGRTALKYVVKHP
jgi:pimeloyl-ACP methyl ester carboxylesterase